MSPWVHEIKIQHVNKGWRRNVKEWHRWISSSIMTHSNRQSSFLSAYQWVNKNKNIPIFLRKNCFATIVRTCWKNEITFQSNYQQHFYTVVQFWVVIWNYFSRYIVFCKIFHVCFLNCMFFLDTSIDHIIIFFWVKAVSSYMLKHCIRNNAFFHRNGDNRNFSRDT